MGLNWVECYDLSDEVFYRASGLGLIWHRPTERTRTRDNELN